jgi:hypothetical protein
MSLLEDVSHNHTLYFRGIFLSCIERAPIFILAIHYYHELTASLQAVVNRILVQVNACVMIYSNPVTLLNIPTIL